MRTSVVIVLLLAAVAVPFGCRRASESVPLAEPVPASSKPRVRLAVLVVFDQLRGDFLDKWKPLFGKDGFTRLQTDGAWFTKCHYPYGTTTTGPGHASMLSGTCPDKHGIVNNNWFEGGADAYCAGSSRYELVPAPMTKPDPKAKPKKPAAGPMLAETIARRAPAEHRRRVFGLSLKDRSRFCPRAKSRTVRTGSTAGSSPRRTTRTAFTRGSRSSTSRNRGQVVR